MKGQLSRSSVGCASDWKDRMNSRDLREKFAIAEILDFDENEYGLTRAIVSTNACSAELYLQGAHLTQWQLADSKPVLFLSERSEFRPGKAIRGGIPIIFPWFGARTATAYSSRTDGPSHGFARTSNWQFASATMDGDALRLKLTLEPNELSRSLGYDDFRLIYDVTVGADLRLQLTVENRMQRSMTFEEALHSYFMVGDATQAEINGLADTEYFDKTDGFKRKRQNNNVLVLNGETDRPYIDSEAQVTLDDPVLKRRLSIGKQNSKTTVVWNPWSELSAKLADLGSDGWRQMVCIETANAMENAVTIEPGEHHTMQAFVTVSG